MELEMRGAPVAKALGAKLAERVGRLADEGVVPTLAIIRVGDRPDDLTYERAATKRCEGLGMAVRRVVLHQGCAQEELLGAIREANSDPSVHGCLLFRPLPEHLDEVQACEELAFQKDVDGVTRASSFGVYASQSLGFSPCTAEACVCLLDHYDVALDGARVTVVGRSLVIGRPVAMLLQARDATVTLCHSHTVDLAGACREADVIVVATGRPNTLRPEHVRPGQVVVDVGINWDEENQRLVGDVDFEGVAPIVRAITPVPRGVGSVTTAVLAEHVVRAAERSVR